MGDKLELKVRKCLESKARATREVIIQGYSSKRYYKIGDVISESGPPIKDYHTVFGNAKTRQGIFPSAIVYLAIAKRILRGEFYSIKDKWVALLRVLSVSFELINRERPPYITSHDTLLGVMISITNLITCQPVNNKFNSNKCRLSQLDIEGVKVRLTFLQNLLDEDSSEDQCSSGLPWGYDLSTEPSATSTIEGYKDFESVKFGDSFMTPSADIYLAQKIYNLYEIISDIENSTTIAIANNSVEQTQKFLSSKLSIPSNLFVYSSSSEFTYEDIHVIKNTLIIRQDGSKNKEVNISPGLTEAVAAACKSIKQYLQAAGRSIYSLPLNLRCEDDEYIKRFINYGKYCELSNYFRDDCKRLIFEGYLQTIMYSMLKVDEELCNYEKVSSGENVHQMLKQIFSFDDLKDKGIPVEQRYANYAMKYIHVYKESLQNHISKLRSHLEKKHGNSDQGHKILNISKQDYEEAKACEDLELFIDKFVEGADFEVRKMAPENFNISVNNKVYVASILLQYAVMENDSGMNMNMVQKLLRLKADPRVENLCDGMSAVGIALLYENSVEKFLREFTTRRRHLTENKSDVNKCLISSDLRIIEDYSTQEIIMDLLKHLYYFT